MTPERWAEIGVLFDDAAALPFLERPGFLRDACGDDHTLRREVERLLDLEGRVSQDFLESPLPTQSVPLRFPSEAETPERIGGYRVIRELHRGGMGIVYLAERDDTYRQRVAVKILPRASAPDSRRRFDVERQILARLEHPNIARIYDGCTTDAGVPYLVLEYIDGLPLTEDCDRRRLTLTERILLFLAVLEAVDLAHRRLVVHRDLKPGNILVTAEGTPKLLDFGIAKLRGRDQVFGENAITAPGEQLMTPGYASPEQIRGDDVDVASDIYSAGVLLFELLTGLFPYRLKAAPSLKELAVAICEQPPRRPHQAIADLEAHPGGQDHCHFSSPGNLASICRARSCSPAELRRGLAGDLDTIVAKALRKEPDRRYASVEELAADLRNYLAQRPIRARPDTFSYRSGKFLRRNWAPTLATVLGLVFGLASVGLVLWQNERVRIEQERSDRALEELAFLLQESGNLAITLRSLEPCGPTKTVLEEALEMRRGDHGDEHPRVAQPSDNETLLRGTWSDLAHLYRAWGKPEEMQTHQEAKGAPEPRGSGAD